ncbi:unnamed protein product [Choristocarpus tenellus]
MLSTSRNNVTPDPDLAQVLLDQATIKSNDPIDVSVYGVDAPQVCCLARLLSHPHCRIRALSLPGATFTSESSMCASHMYKVLAKQSTLTRLDLKGANLGDKEATGLANMLFPAMAERSPVGRDAHQRTTLTRLEHLCLDDTQITGHGLKVIIDAILKYVTSLRSLEVAGNHLGKEVGIPLSRMLLSPNMRVQALHLDVGLAAIAGAIAIGGTSKGSDDGEKGNKDVAGGDIGGIVGINTGPDRPRGRFNGRGRARNGGNVEEQGTLCLSDGEDACSVPTTVLGVLGRSLHLT